MCKQCEGPLPPQTAGRGRPRVFCTTTCKLAHVRDQRAATRQAVRVANRKPCRRCGGPIPPELRAGTVYCSYECKKLDDNDDWRGERGAAYNRRYLYGISPQEWEAMLIFQGGRCAICWTDQWGGKTGHPHADHDHETGRFRGILCDSHNQGLGRFAHNPALLIAAADYLKRT